MKNKKAVILVLLAVSIGSTLTSHAREKAAESTDLHARIDAAVREVLAAGTVPSVSIAVVRDGCITHVKAYGKARLAPDLPARPAMRYSSGSISKQFTAAAILMLAEEGKLRLDDPVSRFLPYLTRSAEITIRQLLSHTSGYQDYWPQDYVTPFIRDQVSPSQILERWACKPLDFEPGAEFQYSNTGYVIAGLIVERAGGQPLFEFLRQRIFAPLGMTSVLDVNAERLTDSDAVGYTRFGMGPLRPAPKEGKGWLFAAGELAITAEDLAKWDVSLINKTLLKPESYREMESAALLSNGLPSNYGLGLDVGKLSSHRKLSHGGLVSGFLSLNLVFPDDKAAVVALSNGEGEAVGPIGSRVSELLLPKEDHRQAEDRARQILDGLRRGCIDRSLFSENANDYFSQQALADFAAGFKALGKPLSFTQKAQEERGGMTFRSFEVKFRRQTALVLQRTLPDGKIEQYQMIRHLTSDKN